MVVKLSMLPHVNYGTVYQSPYDRRLLYKVLKCLKAIFSQKPTELESFYSLIGSFLKFHDFVI